jgi:hypothetical protein
MWGYYGSKSNIVSKYPNPKYYRIIEPFAGTAQYALKNYNNDITINEKDVIVYRLWKWLQDCRPNDILTLPKLKVGENVDNFKWECDEAKWLVGFIIVGAATQPKKTASIWKTEIRPNTQRYKLKLIANNLFKIKEWEILNMDYTELKNEEATWFIDPPYQVGGQYYRYGSKKINYPALSEWCKDRIGQLIVCENQNGTWLPFKPLCKNHGNKKETMECVYLQ